MTRVTRGALIAAMIAVAPALPAHAQDLQQKLAAGEQAAQVVMSAGTASLAQAGPGLVSLKFPGYVKAGDALTLTFESAVSSLRRIDVATYLDQPSDAVSFTVTMQSLPDGTNYPTQVTLGIPGRQVEVRVTKSNYQ